MTSDRNRFWSSVICEKREVRVEPDIRKIVREASLELFGKVGYAKTTVADIANEAKIGKGTIYNYYSSKEEILSDIFSELVRNAQEDNSDTFFAETISIEEKIKIFTSYFVDSFFQMKSLLVGALDNFKPNLITEIFSAFHKNRSTIVNFICQFLKSEIKTSDEKLQYLVGEYFDFLIGRLTLYALETDWNDSEGATQKLLEHTASLFQAIVLKQNP